jgi:hypothetical protein
MTDLRPQGAREDTAPDSELANTVPEKDDIVLALAAASRSRWDDQVAEERWRQEHEQTTQSQQDTRWRRILFWLAVVLVPICLVASTIAGFWYMAVSGGHASPAALSAWFGSSVIQVIGILLVITRHLFPEHGISTRR